MTQPQRTLQLCVDWRPCQACANGRPLSLKNKKVAQSENLQQSRYIYNTALTYKYIETSSWPETQVKAFSLGSTKNDLIVQVQNVTTSSSIFLGFFLSARVKNRGTRSHVRTNKCVWTTKLFLGLQEIFISLWEILEQLRDEW